MKLRIIAGKYKARLISAPNGIRPTKDIVREAVFNVMADCVKGANVLDLFAGSGSFGIEALSRGASYAIFVDSSKACAKIIEENIKRITPEDAEKTQIFIKDVEAAIRLLYAKKEKFDIIFLDPPYYKGWIKKCLKYFSVYDILSPSGIILAEHFKKDDIPANLAHLTLIRQLTYGDTTISIYNRTCQYGDNEQNSSLSRKL
jgi:16S rRNA (guanine(966)-N(2))-methyltransferase RsmD